MSGLDPSIASYFTMGEAHLHGAERAHTEADMPQNEMTVERWVELFRAIGLSDDDMHRWHREFETRYPEGHQDFLEWLRIPETRIGEIRKEAATG